jgi:hypothetical protein
MNDEKRKNDSIYLFMGFLIIHNSSFIIYLRPPEKLLIKAVMVCSLKKPRCKP